MRIVISAGPTVEDIDAVRFISNRSSGRMGYALASGAVERGWRTVLVSGPVELEPPAGLEEFVPVRSAAEMEQALLERFSAAGALVMAAAVADFRPARKEAGKIRRRGRLLLKLVPTVDILAELGRRKGNQVLVGFALEPGGTDDPAARAEALEKARRKRLDAIVLNGPENIGSDRGGIVVLAPDGRLLARAEGGKDALARAVLDVVGGLADERRRHPQETSGG